MEQLGYMGRKQKLMDNFTNELTKLINKHSMENDAGTPDFILARYLADCLRNFNKAVNARDSWLSTASDFLASTKI